MNDTQNALAQDEKARKWVQNKQSLSLYIPSPVLSITPGNTFRGQAFMESWDFRKGKDLEDHLG